MLLLEPIFEADLRPEQYAYRPGRNANMPVGRSCHRIFVPALSRMPARSHWPISRRTLGSAIPCASVRSSQSTLSEHLQMAASKTQFTGSVVIASRTTRSA
jgi:hypothetical protein